jgi:hypothetical protein
LNRIFIGSHSLPSLSGSPFRFFIVASLYRLYRTYAAHLDTSSRHSTSRRSVALALAVRLVASSRGSTTRASCVRVPRHVARLVVDYFAYNARPGASARHAARRRPHVVSPLDFSSVGRTGSHRASGHCVSRRDYSSSGLHRLYCAYVVHPDAPSRRSTSRRSVALALAVRSLTVSRGATTRRSDCTGSTAPMPCTRSRRLTA